MTFLDLLQGYSNAIITVGIDQNDGEIINGFEFDIDGSGTVIDVEFVYTENSITARYDVGLETFIDLLTLIENNNPFIQYSLLVKNIIGIIKLRYQNDSEFETLIIEKINSGIKIGEKTITFGGIYVQHFDQYGYPIYGNGGGIS